MDPLLIIDVHNRAWTHWHSKKDDLSYKGQQTGILFGILTDITTLLKRFDSKKIAFCFDLGKPYRCNKYPQYKSNRRKDLSEQELEQYKAVTEQIRLLRVELLSEIGFRNIFAEDGFEADDIIASICKDLPEEENAIIVSTDKDFYQCLKSNIEIYRPQQNNIVTNRSFYQEFGLKPRYWPKVKAIMGDPGDCVPGIKGVGVKTAIKWIKKEYESSTVKRQSQELQILAFIKEGDYQRNLDLVKLPWPGSPKPEIVEDKIDRVSWKAVCKRFGLSSLRKLCPR